MTEQSHNSQNQEIDLGQVSRQIKGLFSRVNDSIFDGILFLKRNLIIVMVLIIAGAGLGYYLDSNQRLYTHEMYVIPNFESVDYLYSEVEHISAKIKEQDKAFLKQCGIVGKMGAVEIEPVVDIYNFIRGDNRNYDMFKLLAENNDVNKVVEDEATGKTFKRHLIKFTTVGTTTREKTVDPILKYLNSNTYFNSIKQQGIENLQTRIAVNDSTLKQIDALLNDFSRSKAAKGNLMYYNDNTPLNEIINIKNGLVREQAQNKVDLINARNIISDSGFVLNNKYSEGLTGKMKYILPLLFVLLFSFLYIIRKYYKHQMLKRQ